MTVRVMTASGACYEADLDALTVCRMQTVSSSVDGWCFARLRRDGEPLRLAADPGMPVVGWPWVLTLEPLDSSAEVTVRVTTPVVEVETVV